MSLAFKGFSRSKVKIGVYLLDLRYILFLICVIVQLDDLSHKGSGYSLEMGANSTPKSGSLENLAGGEFLRRSDNPAPAKPPRTPAPATPHLPTAAPRQQPVMDEWEQKLYGKYGKGT